MIIKNENGEFEIEKRGTSICGYVHEDICRMFKFCRGCPIYFSEEKYNLTEQQTLEILQKWQKEQEG